MPLEIIREDIRRVKVDAIVNPTDENYSGSGGTDYKVHKAAGERLDEEVSRLPKLNVGDARITSSFSMDNTFYIIHTRGPIYIDGKHNEDKLLRRCYENCLRIVKEKKLQSVALPLISTGTFGFPLKEAMKIASNVITDFIFDNDIYVYLLVYNRQAFDISKKFHQDIKDYLKDNGVDEEDYYDEKEYIGYRRSRRNIKDNNPVVYNPIDDNFMDDYENTESFN
ncbi:MAG: macro domain-containing protein, partial [Erysipelotrichaceae bacterium]|nr:macro domain-containing protein [Erysipelotrichaceae bacterium]